MLGNLSRIGHLRCLARVRGSACYATDAGRRVECRHILVDSKEKLQTVAIRLEGGDSFADLASEFSQCPSSGAGGRIGWVSRGMADAAIEQSVLDKPVGSLTQVVSSSGFHLVEVLSESTPQGASEGPEAGAAALQKPWQQHLRSASVRDLACVLQNPEQREEAQFVDVREVCEFEAARVEHFRLFPMSQASTWLAAIHQHLDPEKDTYVLCHHGVRSMHACQFLAKRGFSSLFNVSGGIARYSADVDPSVPQY